MFEVKILRVDTLSYIKNQSYQKKKSYIKNQMADIWRGLSNLWFIWRIVGYYISKNVFIVLFTLIKTEKEREASPSL